MQETFINAYKNIDKFENRSSFKTWITQIMLNNCYHKKKKLNYNLETDQEMKEHHDPLYSNKHLETQKLVLNRELGHVIENALNQLQEEYRMVFSLREINGFNVSETAALLNISESNVKTRLSRAKDMLQNQLMQSYQATDLYAFNLIYCDAIVKRVMDEINTL
jgi:RNA polymerase sigma-70 factor (ECF subfamily)